MYVDIDESYEQICEMKITRSKDSASIVNKFARKPQGIIVQDSYNNPFFPIQPKPRVDSAKMDLREVYKRFHELYGEEKALYLPWHFCVELVGNQYYVFNTRPLDMKFPITNNEAKKLPTSPNWDVVANLFFDDNIFDISDAIHVCIIGDTNYDVYTKRTYEVVGRSCINPTVRQYKLPSGLYQRIFGFNLGKRFNLDYITKFIRK